MVLPIENLDDQILFALYKEPEHTIVEQEGLVTREVHDRIADIFSTYPPRKSITEEMRKLENSGFIQRDTRGKRTYSVSLAEPGLRLVRESMVPAMSTPDTPSDIAEAQKDVMDKIQSTSVSETISQALSQVHAVVDENAQLHNRNMELMDGLSEIAGIITRLLEHSGQEAES